MPIIGIEATPITRLWRSKTSTGEVSKSELDNVQFEQNLHSLDPRIELKPVKWRPISGTRNTPYSANSPCSFPRNEFAENKFSTQRHPEMRQVQFRDPVIQKVISKGKSRNKRVAIVAAGLGKRHVHRSSSDFELYSSRSVATGSPTSNLNSVVTRLQSLLPSPGVSKSAVAFDSIGCDETQLLADAVLEQDDNPLVGQNCHKNESYENGRSDDASSENIDRADQLPIPVATQQRHVTSIVDNRVHQGSITLPIIRNTTPNSTTLAFDVVSSKNSETDYTSTDSSKVSPLHPADQTATSRENLSESIPNWFQPNRNSNAFKVTMLDNEVVNEGKSVIPLSAVPHGMLDSITENNTNGLIAAADGLRNEIPLLPLGSQIKGSGHALNQRGDFMTRSSREMSLGGISSFSNKTVIPGSVITFQDIHYVVTTRKTICSKPKTKTVLKDISGIMRPGLNAIMGPTGCGKSSLLDVLAGRKDPKFLSGKVLIDGEPQPKNFKCISGYVVQDDILMGTLTVRESVYLAAVLRRKATFTSAELNTKVDEVLEELGISHVANSKIGTEFLRGISGGERKRTSIGMEIVSDPSVLFLDEPTTGLDAFTAGSVISTLKALSRRGRTIVLSIHQPKYSIYKLFDSLTLVCNGQIAYQGLGQNAPIRYFARYGYHCEDHNSPPDFFLDIIHGEIRPFDPDDECPVVDMIYEDYDVSTAHSTHQMKLVADNLIQSWKESTEFNSSAKLALWVYVQRFELILNGVQSIRNQVNAITQHHVDGGTTDKPPVHISYSAPFCRQMRIVCWRTFINLVRDPQASIVQILVYLFFAVSMGVVYFGLNTSLETGIQNRAGLFFFATLQVVFVNIGSIELFLKERAIFIHEHSSGYYRVSAYFLAKLICDVVPTKALPVFFFMPITYWMVKLVPLAGNFFFFELILTLGTVSAAAIALFVSASVTLFSVANVIISIVFVFMMVFGGFLINLNSMGAWLSWLRYFSIFRYTLGGLLVNEMATLTFCPYVNRTTADYADGRTCQTGHQYLMEMGLSSDTLWDLWSNMVGLTCISIVCFVLCYIQLRRINTYK